MSNTTRFNEELVSLVHSGKLAIEYTDSESNYKLLVLLLNYIFPDSKKSISGYWKYYRVSYEKSNMWFATNMLSDLTGKPVRPVSDFFLPAVSDGEEEADKRLTDKELIDFLRSPNKPIKINDLKNILNEYDKEEISFSRFAEKLNEIVFYWNKSKQNG